MHAFLLPLLVYGAGVSAEALIWERYVGGCAKQLAQASGS